MKARLLALAAKINGVTPRERALLLMTGIVILYGVFEVTFLKKHDARIAKLNGQLSQVNADIGTLEAQINEISAQFEHDPDAAEKAQKKEVEVEIAALDEELKRKMGGLVTPARMASILEEVLQDQKGLRLTQLKSLLPQPLLSSAKTETAEAGNTAAPAPTPASPPPASSVGVFRHGLMLEFEGDYLSTLNYVKALEALPWELYWDTFDLEVVKYPKAQIRIQVHTISTDVKWIGV